MQPFHPFFPLAESMAKAFYWFFIWKFKRKAPTISMIQPKKIALAQHLIDTVSYQLISLISLAGRVPRLKTLSSALS